VAVDPGFRWGRLLTMVASTIAYSMSGSSEAASKSRLKTSARTQSRYRLKTVFQRPKSAGKSRQGLPVRAIHNTASIKRRLSVPLRPGSDFFPRQCGSIFAHWASVSTNRSITSLNHNILPKPSQISTGPSTTAGFRQKYVVSNGFSEPAAGAGGASATRRTQPHGQAVGPRPGATAGGALPAR